MNEDRQETVRRRRKCNELRSSGRYFPALVAAGSVLFSLPAAALELGALTVESPLGQPLRASIAYALGPNEQLANYCIFIGNRVAANGLPVIGNASATLDGGRILLSTQGVMREPMMSLQLTVDCPYTPHLRRDYLLMLSPATAVNADAHVVRRATTAASSVTAATRSPTAAATLLRRSTPRPVSSTPVTGGNRYRVQAGDTLSGIAARIPDRRLTLWPAVDALYAANPDAFIGGDRNRLKLGAELTIPESLTAATIRPTTIPASVNSRYAGVPTQSPAAAVPGTPARTATVEPAPATTGTPAAAAPATEAREPVSRPATRPVKVPAGVSATRTNADPVPIVGNRVSADRIDAGGPLSWLSWLGAAGVAIILGLLLFGRTLRERFGAEALQPRQRRSTDRDQAIDDHESGNDLQTTISRARLFELDADLDNGSGLGATTGVDVVEDFNYASSDDYTQDLDLTFEDQPADDRDDSSTDIISPPAHDQTVIVDSEVLPNDDDDDATGYDLSMVVDATKQPFDDVGERTLRDLQAVEVSALDHDMSSSGSYTLNEPAGYSLIEQDYEDELSATQILHRQMDNAAQELAKDLDQEGEHNSLSADATQESMAQDLDNTAEVTSTLPTETPAVNDALDDVDVTVEMPADQNEETVEMEAKQSEPGPRHSKAS